MRPKKRFRKFKGPFSHKQQELGSVRRQIPLKKTTDYSSNFASKTLRGLSARQHLARDEIPKCFEQV